MRNGFLNPEEVVKNLDLIKPGMQVGDFGCGSGYFTIPLSRMVGPGGTVFAVDVLQSALEAVRSRSRIEGIFNIEPIRANLEQKGSLELKDGSLSVVFLSKTLFQTPNKPEVFKEAARVLKTGGYLVCIEWKTDAPIGPPREKRIPQEELKRLAMAHRFTFLKEVSLDAYHYGLLFEKQP